MRAILCSSGAAALLAATASGQVFDFVGDIGLEAAPPSLALQAYESGTRISLIQEKTGHVLTSDLAVNAVGPGLYDSTAALTPAFIPAGKKVDSWLLHNDAPGVITDWANSLVLGGGFTFERKILGVIALNTELDASDGEVGLPGVFYAAGSNRGMELDLKCPELKYDRFAISADERSITLITHTDRQIDEIRIITEALGPVPAPGAGGLLGTAGLLCARRRR